MVITHDDLLVIVIGLRRVAVETITSVTATACRVVRKAGSGHVRRVTANTTKPHKRGTATPHCRPSGKYTILTEHHPAKCEHCVQHKSTADLRQKSYHKMKATEQMEEVDSRAVLVWMY